MNIKHTRQYEMLLRVRDFARTHRDIFPPSTAAQQAFAAVGTAVDELTATDLRKISASVAARAGRKAAARKALAELLLRVTQLGKVLRARGQTTAAFELPESRSDQTLLTVARQFARDAAPLDAEFASHGMSPAHIAGVAALFEAAIRDRGMSRSDHTAARTRIQELLSSALMDVRRLDLIVDNELADNAVIQAVWKQARRLEEPRGPRANAAAGQPAQAEPGAAPSPARAGV